MYNTEFYRFGVSTRSGIIPTSECFFQQSLGHTLTAVSVDATTGLCFIPLLSSADEHSLVSTKMTDEGFYN